LLISCIATTVLGDKDSADSFVGAYPLSINESGLLVESINDRSAPFESQNGDIPFGFKLDKS
jgi:hypothetical protein